MYYSSSFSFVAPAEGHPELNEPKTKDERERQTDKQ